MEDNKYARFLRNNINTRNLHKLKPSNIKASIGRLKPVNTSSVKDAIKGSFTKLTNFNKSDESSSDSQDSDYDERLEQYQQMYEPQETVQPQATYEPQQKNSPKYGTTTSWSDTGLRSPPMTPKVETESDPPSNASTADSSSSSSSSSSAKQSSSSTKVSSSPAKGSSTSSPSSTATEESHQSSISAPETLPPWTPISYTQARMVPSANWSPKSGSFIYHSRSESKLTKKVSFSDEKARLQSRSRREEAPIPNMRTNFDEKPSELAQRPSDMLKEQLSSYLTSELMPDEKPSDILIRDRRGKFYTVPGRQPKIDLEAQLSFLLSVDDNKLINKPSSEPLQPVSIMKTPSTIPQIRSSVETVASVTTSLGHRFTEPAENSRNRSVNVSGKPIPNSHKSSNTEKKKKKKKKKNLNKCHRPRLQMETNLDWVKTYLQYKPKPLPPPPKKTKKEIEEDKALKVLHDKLQENADKLNAIKNRKKDKEEIKAEEDFKLYEYDGHEPHKGRPPTAEILSRGKPTTNLQTIYTYLTVVDNSGSEAELFVDPNKRRKKKGNKKKSSGEEFIIMFAAEDKKEDKKESSSETDTGLQKDKQTNTKKKRLKRIKKKKEARKKLTTRLVTNICFMKSLFLHCWSREGLKPLIVTKELDHTEGILT